MEPLEEQKRLRQTLEAARLRRETLEATRRALASLGEAAEASHRSIDALYMAPLDRVRVAASLSGIGIAAAALALGATPAYMAAPRILNNILTLARTGRRVKVAREANLGLRAMLEEILA